MNLLAMHYFLTVIEYQSITNAARHLHITQQTLSAHIAAMEKNLNCTLFRRKPNFEMTDAGLIFAQYCHQFEQLNISMEQEFEDLAEEQRGTLTIGIAYTRGKVLMPRLIPAYQKLYPNMQICLTEQTNSILIERLATGEIDLVIGNFPQDMPEFCSQEFYRERLFLLLPPQLLEQEVLDRLKQEQDLSLLTGCPFVMNSQNDIAGRLGNAILKKAQIIPKITAISDNIETLLELCVKGVGACFCPDLLLASTLTQEQQKNLIILPLESDYPIRLAWKNQPYIKKAITAFADISLQQELPHILKACEK